MKVFIAKWPDLDITIVGATNLEEAKFYLSEFGDTNRCIIDEYTGPMVFDFRGPNLLPKSAKYPIFVEGEEAIYNGYENKYKRPTTENFYAKYYFQSTYSDIVLLLSGKKIPAHKMVLSRFPACFSEDLLNCEELEIENVAFETFRVILYFIYHNHLDIIESDLNLRKLPFLFDCFKFARRYKMTRLSDLLQREMTIVANSTFLMDLLDGFVTMLEKDDALSILKIAHQAHKLGAMKFLYFLLERLSKKYPGDLKQLDSKYGEKMESYKSGYSSIWNEKAMEEMKSKYPFNFKLNENGGASRVSKVMWEKIQQKVIPDLHKTLCM